MHRDPSEPGLEIFSPAWYDTIFESTIFNDKDKLWVREAAEKICKAWALGNSTDPLLVAQKIHTIHSNHLHNREPDFMAGAKNAAT
jgi:hypothetical protein